MAIAVLLVFILFLAFTVTIIGSFIMAQFVDVENAVAALRQAVVDLGSRIPAPVDVGLTPAEADTVVSELGEIKAAIDATLPTPTPTV